MTSKEIGATNSAGRILVFHSPLPGSSCTTSLANVAWNIASTGRSVLLVDFNLRSPELREYFSPLFGLRGGRPQGLVDMITGVIEGCHVPGADPAGVCARGADLGDQIERLSRWPVIPGVPEGEIGYLGPGTDHAARLTRLDTIHGSGFARGGLSTLFLRALRSALEDSGYDHVLVDTAPGDGLLGRRCAAVLADQVALCLTLGTTAIHRSARIAADLRAEAPHVPVRPVLTRVDLELPNLDELRDRVYATFAPWVEADQDDPWRYWGRVEIPYKARIAERLTLAAFLERTWMPSSLFHAYERLTSVLTGGEVPRGRHLTQEQSEQVRLVFEQIRHGAVASVVLLADSRDRSWADWVQPQLEWVGIRVHRPRPDRGSPLPDTGGQGIIMALVSDHLHGSPAFALLNRLLEAPQGRGGNGAHRVLGVTIGEGTPPPDFPDAEWINLRIREEDDARGALLARFDPRFPSHRSRGPGQGPSYPGAPNPELISNAPHGNQNFSGREGFLERLRDLLGQGMEDKPPVVLVGMQGSGKSEIVREFVRRFRSDYDLIWWIRADRPEKVEASLSELAATVAERFPDHRSPGAEPVLAALRAGRPLNRWLLVYDNAGPPGGLDALIPHDHGHVIITSYHREWEAYGHRRCLHVGPFSEGEVAELFRDRLPEVGAEDALALSRRLGHLPAQLHRALEWLNSGQRLDGAAEAVAEYARLLDEREPSVVRGAGSFEERLSSSLALDELEQYHPASLCLIRLAAYLSPDGFPEDLLRSPRAVSEYGEADPAYRAGRVNFNHVHFQLTRVLLMDFDRQLRMFSVHPAVQEVVRDRIPAGERARVRESVCQVLASYAPHDEEADDPRHDRRYQNLRWQIIPSGAHRSRDDEVRRWLVNQVRYHHRKGELEAALELGSPLLRHWTDAFGERDRLRLHLATQLANVHRSRGEHREAGALNGRTLELQREVLGERHPFTLLTRRGMGADLRALGRFRSALDHDRETYSAYLAGRGPHHQHTLLAEHNLALSLSAAGDYPQALSVGEGAHRVTREVLGQGHPYTWILSSAAATYRRRTGEYVMAHRQIQQAARMLSRTIGELSSHTLHALKELAANERLVGDPGQALERIRRTHERHRREYGGEHPRSLAMGLELAACLAARERHDLARTQALTCTEGYAEVFGEDHPFTLVARANLAAYACRSGHVREAEVQARRAQEGLTADPQVGAGHPLALGAAVNLANALVAKGEIAEAVALDVRTQEELHRVCGTHHPHYELAYANYLNSTARHMGDSVSERGHVDLEVPEI
ncbi:FxSxx-COOH system tetratricopeptide repeat protein [Nocardiopsis sp. NPDC007018]|uniref:FxSxx-COOH system tetratricopeptide repeat protein n=1 Tax=Nocardiopsis sp. NPDC007018 TaxID=3155721 RepID=UPI0033E5C975